MMRQTKMRLALVLSGLLYYQLAYADEILVVMGQAFAVDKLSTKQLANIYRRKTMINQAGERWNPINLSANNPLRIAFAEKIFQQPPEAMEAYWNTQYFQGIMPPYAVNSVEAMVRVLEATPGAIGYLLPCQLDKRVKVVFKLAIDGTLTDMCKP